MSSIRRLYAPLSRSLLVLLVVCALALTSIRVGLSLIDHYRQPLLRTFATALGVELEAERLRAGLVGLRPYLAIDGLVLRAPDAAAPLRLDTLAIELAPLASLRAGAPRLAGLGLAGGQLVLVRDGAGRLSLPALDGLGGGDPEGLVRLLERGRVTLADIDLDYHDPELSAPLRLTGLGLTLDNGWRGRRVALAAVLPGLAGRIEARARLHGPLREPGRWWGRVVARVAASRLESLPTQWAGQALPRVAGGEVELWAELVPGRLTGASIALALDGVASAAGEPVLRRAQALAQLRPGREGWRLRLADLDLVGAAGGAVAITDLTLDLDPAGRPRALVATAPALDLGALGGLLQASPRPVPAALAGLLSGAPRGRLEACTLAVALPVAAPPRWRFDARLVAIGVERQGHWPGLSGLDGVLSVDQDGGQLALASPRLGLDLAPLFDRPLHFSRFDGVLRWHRAATGWRLASESLELATADLAGVARFGLELPGAGASPLLDLRARFHDGDAAHTRRYLPVGQMHPRLVAWLERAIVAGRVPEAEVLFRGPLAAYPFRAQEGRFELRLDYADTRLDYLPGYPPLEGARGELRFLNQGMTVRLDRARVLDSDVSAGWARLPDLRDSRVLEIHAEADGPFADGVRVLRESPLRARLGALAARLEASGDSHLALDIGLPLKREQPLALSGRLTWPENAAALRLVDTPLRLAELDGALSFDTQGVAAESITARLWGRPLQLALRTEPERVVLEAASRTPVETLAAQLPAPLWSSLDGELDWRLTLGLAHAELGASAPRLDWQLESGLEGLALALPAPLGKRAEGRRRLDLAGTLVPDQRLAVAGRVGTLGVNLAVGLSPARLERAHLRLDGAAPRPGRDGVFIDGRVKRLDLDAWSAWARRRSGGGAGATPLVGVEVVAEEARLGALRLHHAGLALTPEVRGWRLGVDSRELAGAVVLATAADASGAPLRLDLDRLDLDALLASSGDTGGAARAPGDWPALDLAVADLRWGGEGLGRLALELRPSAAGIGIPRLRLSDGERLALSGSANWRDGPGGGHSRVTLALESGDLGELLRRLGYRSVLEGAPVDAHAELDWPGAPGDYALARTHGWIDVDIGAGRLLELEPGVGRVLGFLNLGAISRRLALDFSDLYAQGFAFERMQGRLLLADGQAGSDRFEVVGPSSRLIIGGLTDLIERRFDQTVVLEPKLGSSVALASAVAGGPVVGAAVYLVDRVAGNAIDRLGRYQYRVSGPWREPQVTPLGWDPLLVHAVAPDEASPSEAPVNLFLD
ncbi:YhdP family protein [Marichromatium bheemlicum]|uniref:TIGR02099 family protein n=1 Tax=Marichromatium bheemlicum TaxID=365339 RepID=A0ABX1IA34_9GAMM|nr:YhdP family protein [Marichromatium bheemlicum]NKN34408.1 TIGR02099 family protein [Marichromatium bheemlicum]